MHERSGLIWAGDHAVHEDHPGKDSATYVLEVPMDDTKTSTYLIAYSTRAAVDREALRKLLGYDSPLYDPETRSVRLEWEDRLGQDRSILDRRWSGYRGIEHLVIADRAVMRVRPGPRVDPARGSRD